LEKFTIPVAIAVRPAFRRKGEAKPISPKKIT